MKKEERITPVLTRDEQTAFQELLRLDQRSDARSISACKRVYAVALSEGFSAEEINKAYKLYSLAMLCRNGESTDYTKSLYAWLTCPVEDRYSMRAYVAEQRNERVERAKQQARDAERAARLERERNDLELIARREEIINATPELRAIQQEIREAMRKTIHAPIDTPERASLHDHWKQLASDLETKVDCAIARSANPDGTRIEKGVTHV